MADLNERLGEELGESMFGRLTAPGTVARGRQPKATHPKPAGPVPIAPGATPVREDRAVEAMEQELLQAAPLSRWDNTNGRRRLADRLLAALVREGEQKTVEICNDCGGLVGWERLRAESCPGGVVCERESGTRFVRALLLPGEDGGGHG